jgi:hypothetical protein
MSVVNAIPLIAAGDDGYSLSRSLRFRSSASAYLNRTQSSGSSQKFTLSQWVKRGKLGATQYLFTAFNASTDGICFSSSDQLEVFFANGSSYDLITTAVYRDPAAWYHIVVLVDTTQATAANRVQLYVNGVAVSFGSGTQPPQNYNFANFNANAVVARIGTQSTGVNYLDGYLAEVNFIDGQALTPSSFGAFSPYNQWLPKKYAGTYGTNGFYLPFTNNASTTTLGYDFSIAAYSDNLRSSGTNTGTFTANGGLAAAFDGNTNQPNASSAKVSVPAAGYNTAVIGKDWGAGVTKTITAVRLFSQNDGGFVGGTTNALTFKLQGSNDNSAWTDLTSAITGPATGAGTLISVTSGITTTTAYRYHRINVNANGADNYYMCELEFYEAGTHGFNNWTTNNISVTAGSTYDSMTDVPTLTSPTTSNYVVVNPLVTSSAGTISAGNLNVSGTATSGQRQGTMGASSGKWYWEVSTNWDSSQASFYAGVSKDTVLPSLIPGQGVDSYTVGVGGQSTIFSYNNLVQTSYTATPASPVVLQIALDLDTNKVWFGVNNTWVTGNPTAGTGQTYTIANAGTYLPAFRASGGATSTTGSFNAGQQPFVYTPPSGYVALNTFNL